MLIGQAWREQISGSRGTLNGAQRLCRRRGGESWAAGNINLYLTHSRRFATINQLTMHLFLEEGTLQSAVTQPPFGERFERFNPIFNGGNYAWDNDGRRSKQAIGPWEKRVFGLWLFRGD